MAYKFQVGGWIGNLGNHLLQLSQAVFLAERYNGVCTFASERFLEDKTFDFSSGQPLEKTICANFFEPSVNFTPDGRNYEDDLHQERSRILKSYVLPIFKPYQKTELEYDLVINLRGGDVFDGKSYPPYVQAPFSYFVAVIEKEQPQRILVVAQDERNPAVEMLRNSPYNITVLSEGTPETDTNLVLNTKTLVIGGVSTFHHTLAQMSPNLKKVYYPEFGDGWDLAPEELWRKDHWYREENMLGQISADVTKVYFEDYIRIGQWHLYSTDEKCRAVADYPLKKVYI